MYHTLNLSTLKELKEERSSNLKMSSQKYTITVPNCPKLNIGDYVKVVANSQKLNSLKEVKSIKISFDNSKMPRIHTEIGLNELAPDIQATKTIREMRNRIRDESTEFTSSATPVTDEIYYEWDR